MVSSKKSILIKCGGSIINDVEELNILLKNIASLKQQGFQIVIVHGGGPDITRLCKALHVESSFINGQRVTGLDVLEATQMALLGKVNCNLVHKLNMAKVPSIGLSGHDVNLMLADFINKNEMGYVGVVKHVNTDFINNLFDLGITPVIAPIGVDDAGNTFNINADLVASAIAGALKVDKLVLLSDIDGFYLDFNDKSSLVSHLSTEQIDQMLAQNQISGGMIPKLTACTTAIAAGVMSAHIINGNKPNGIISLAHNYETIGTTITGKI